MSRQHTRSVSNMHSTEKAHRRSEKLRMRNKAAKSRARTAVSGVRTAITAGDMDLAAQNLNVALSVLDKTASKGIIHPNNAARRKSRLMKAFQKARQAVAS